MEIKNYKYIQHTITPRKWGAECQFTVSDTIGKMYDDVISIPSTKIEEKELQTLIENKLMQLSVQQIPDIPPFKEISGEEVETYLRDNLIIKSKHTLDMVKTAMAKVAEV